MGDYSDDSQNVPPQNKVDNGFPTIETSIHSGELLPKTDLSTVFAFPEHVEYQGERPQGIVQGKSYRLPKALFLGKLWSDKHTSENAKEKHLLMNKYANILRSDSTCSRKSRHQLEGALNLLTEAGMDPRVSTHDEEDFNMLAAHLKDYRICVWTIQKHTLRPEIIHQQNEQAHGMIPLLCIDGSYDFFIPTVPNVNLSYCFKCHDFGGRYHARTCSAICKKCGSEKCYPDPNVNIFCEKCRISFHSKKCFDAHSKRKSKVSLPCCEKYEWCQKCRQVVHRPSYSKRVHKCHVYFCRFCDEKVNHRYTWAHMRANPNFRKLLNESGHRSIFA